MLIISQIPLFSLVGLLHFLSADGFPIVREYAVEVKMADNSTFEGRLLAERDDLPKWMQPGGAEQMRICRNLYRVLVILKDNNHFCSKPIPFHPRPGHDPRTHSPQYAEIRLQHDEYYTASNFREYPIEVHSHFQENMSLINHIYVTRPGLSVYRSPLYGPFYYDRIDFDEKEEIPSIY